jgi:histone-lysine N-methyltransferase SETD3
MPVFFGKEELELLEGSYLLTQIEDKKADLRKDWETICAIDGRLEEFGFERWCWARMAAASRIFGIIVDGVKTDAFVPMAGFTVFFSIKIIVSDMLNHRRPKQTNWYYSDIKQGFIIETTEEIEKGEAIYDSYGRKCNSRFLLNYGFIVENNDANEVALKVVFREQDPFLKIKEKMIRQKYIGKIFRVLANLDECNTKEFLGFIRFVLIDNQTDLDFLAGCKDNKFFENEAIVIRAQNTPSLSIENEIRMLKYVKVLCQEALGRYRTSLEVTKSKFFNEFY